MTSKSSTLPSCEQADPRQSSGDAPIGALLAPLSQVLADPTQPRRDWDSAAARQALAELVESIREFGILQPLLVRPDPEAPHDAPRYIVVAGGRRREAAARAGLSVVPVVVRDAPGLQVRIFQLTENLLRRDLAPLDEARAYRELMDLETLSAEELGRRLHISGQTVRNRLRILDDQQITDAIARGQISLSAGHLILQLPEAERQEHLARLGAGERVLTQGVIQARRRHREEGAAHPERRGPGRSGFKNVLTPPGAPSADEAPAPGASRAATSPGDDPPPAGDLSAAQAERARILAAVLASALWRGLRETEQAEALAGLREVLTSPQAGTWSTALLLELIQRLGRSRY